MKMIHLVQDEKFIDFFSERLGAIAGCEHCYIVNVPEPTKSLRHITKTDIFRKVDDSYFSSRQMLADISDCDVLLVHFLTAVAAKFIRKVPRRIKIVWSGWGGDYYHFLPGGEKALLGQMTRDLFKKMNFNLMLKNPINIARVLLRLLRRKATLEARYLSAIKRVDFFSSPLPEDFLLLKEALGGDFSAEYLQLNYGDVDHTFFTSSERWDCRNILVGNSASLTNNHLEIFKILASVELGDRKVIVPLSYGDNEYRKHILKNGLEVLGDNFWPIIDFMPLYEYKKIMASCSVVVMNHYRQQALGNIGAILHNGSKLFLNKRSTTFDFFEKRGAYIFDIDDFTSEQLDHGSELSVEQKKKNKVVLDSFWGRDVVTSNFEHFLLTMKK